MGSVSVVRVDCRHSVPRQRTVNFPLKVLLLAETGRQVERMELGVGVLAILDASFDLLGDCGLGVVQDASHL